MKEEEKTKRLKSNDITYVVNHYINLIEDEVDDKLKNVRLRIKGEYVGSKNMFIKVPHRIVEIKKNWSINIYIERVNLSFLHHNSSSLASVMDFG